MPKFAMITAVLLACVPAVAEAGYHPPITLPEIIEKSAAVVRVRVLEIDEAGYDFDTQEALTGVRVEVLETLVGQVDSEITLVFRGGLLPDGARQVWDIVPELIVDQVYVLFLRADHYFITPLVSPFILREVEVNGERVLVNPEGRLVELNLEYPQVGSVVVDPEEGIESEHTRQKGRKHVVRLPRKMQTEAKAFELIRAVGRFRRDKSAGAAVVLPKRPSSLKSMKDLSQ